ncbi:RND transporter [Burkholderia sp. WAC0059]|uniref:efflux transporter outer membrane subunit n=1 Tax=Burkholderia sp. WAC0059 TaxID=2066022 RepID=UPI000C7F2FC0|nr:efflux transporter outer membrane subunit [Burkholderia sp. WAC0059]PLZ02942.1 RND transporter [Burkholderia sp. WAC0059]
MARSRSGLFLAGAAAFALGACSFVPNYKVPATPVTAQFRGTGPWVSAKPADRLSRNGWWAIYGDAQLDALQTRLIASNTDLAAAWAHYEQAQAYVSEASSALYPTLSAGAEPQRDRQSNNRPLRAGGPNDYTSATLYGEIDYDLDLWGSVRATVAASRDEAQAEQADLASVELSLEVQLANDYFQIRGLDQQTQLLVETVAAYQKALQLTQTLHGDGVVSGLDVTRAQTQLATAQSELSQTRAQRALLEHAVAVLVGASASEFSLPMQTADLPVPVVPVGVPSDLLQRRPDVAEAERHVAEANEKIGVARAAFFPSITLSAQGGVQSDQYPNLLSAPNFFWAVGPQLAQYIFDGGLRRARLRAARAALDEAGDRYRGVVLGAFQQVEDNLTLLDDLGTAIQQQRDAASAAQHAVDLALQLYKHGAVGYLDVVQAQTTALDTERGVLQLQTQRLGANVQLIHALGGGWSKDELARAAQMPALAATQQAGGKAE